MSRLLPAMYVTCRRENSMLSRMSKPDASSTAGLIARYGCVCVRPYLHACFETDAQRCTKSHQIGRAARSCNEWPPTAAVQTEIMRTGGQLETQQYTSNTAQHITEEKMERMELGSVCQLAEGPMSHACCKNS